MSDSYRAFTFPGQGAQSVGMGREMAEASRVAAEVFEEVDDALEFNLRRLMWEGPEADLTLTENAQPALMATGVAVLRVLTREGGVDLSAKARFVAGHSLGEYTALAASGALTLADAARLLRLRGQAMQRAVPVGKGAMAALLGVDMAEVQAIIDEAKGDDVLSVANDNAPGQIVISGATAAVERAVQLAKTKGKKAIGLPVSAPFHSPLMQPAADEMAEALQKVTIRPPAIPLVANVTAAPVQAPETIRRLLVQQVTGLVRWRESIEAMAVSGVTTFVELGWGRALTGMAKRIIKDCSAIAVATPDELEAFLKTL